MEKINVAELLRNYPKGMELDCTMYEDVYFDYVDELNIIHCYIQHETHKTSLTFNQHGTPNSDIKSKCVIFPIGKTTWEGFQIPFKDGDIISGYYFDAVCIFKGEGNIKGTVDYYCGISGMSGDDEFFIKDVKNQDEHFGDIDEYKLADEEEREKLFQAIKTNGYEWNPKTKTLEKLPKFKIGDRIKNKNANLYHTIKEILGDSYIVDNNSLLNMDMEHFYELTPDIKRKFKVGDRVRLKLKPNYVYTIHSLAWDDNKKLAYRLLPNNDKHLILVSLNAQDDYELVRNKFDITTLKPFDKVLVRDTNGQVWTADFFSHIIDANPNLRTTFVCIGHYPNQCIPYEENKYLLGKTDDCDEYFKVWY